MNQPACTATQKSGGPSRIYSVDQDRQSRTRSARKPNRVIWNGAHSGIITGAALAKCVLRIYVKWNIDMTR